MRSCTVSGRIVELKRFADGMRVTGVREIGPAHTARTEPLAGAIQATT